MGIIRSQPLRPARTSSRRCAADYTVQQNQLDVTVRLLTDGSKSATELFHVIPLMDEVPARQGTANSVLEYSTDGTTWNSFPTDRSYVENVTHVRLTRFGATRHVVFDSPESVGLWGIFEQPYQTSQRRFILHVNLLDTVGSVVPWPNSLEPVVLVYEVAQFISSVEYLFQRTGG